MGLFDLFKKRTRETKVEPPRQLSLLSISYGIAYFILPHYAFNDCDKLASMFIETPTSAGPFYYLMGCQMQKTEPVMEHASLFRVHHGDLNGTHDYFILEYPTPPPVDFSGTDPTKLSEEEMPVLAPYFSAIVRPRQEGPVQYYTLGQAPIGGGTTLRSVTPEGMNCNLGPGPNASLDEFLARLRTKV